MGKLAKMEYAKLDNVIAEHGKEFVIGQVVTRIAEGDDPKDIARSFGVHYVYLKKWLEQECVEDIALAKRAHSDMLVANALSEVESADPDSVQVAKLRVDTYLKIAGKQDKASWGDGSVLGGGMGNITIVIGDVVKEVSEVSALENVIDNEI